MIARDHMPATIGDEPSRKGSALAEGDRYTAHAVDALDEGGATFVEVAIVKDDGAGPYVVTHSGPAWGVRQRVAVDAHPDDVATILATLPAGSKPAPVKVPAPLELPFDLKVDP